MTHLTPVQCAALEQLIAALDGHDLVLVGAGALGFHVNMKWRSTRDLDLVLAVSVDDMSRLAPRLPGWTRDSRLEHRWVAPGDTRFDLLPVGGGALESGRLVWPESGLEMNLQGMRLAFAHADEQPVALNLSLRVPRVEILILLKMVAYLDQPLRRTTDLGDIAYTLQQFLDPKPMSASPRITPSTTTTRAPTSLGDDCPES